MAEESAGARPSRQVNGRTGHGVRHAGLPAEAYAPCDRSDRARDDPRLAADRRALDAEHGILGELRRQHRLPVERRGREEREQERGCRHPARHDGRLTGTACQAQQAAVTASVAHRLNRRLIEVLL